jgi:uncharacterized protein (TIGR03084 family)
VSQVIDDLEAEQDAIAAMVDGLDSDALAQPSGANGWSIADVLLHLAQSEEMVVASITGEPVGEPLAAEGANTDEVVDNWVRAQRGEPAKMLARWQSARRLSMSALRAADPAARYPWIAASLRPDALATTRIAEHWAHALDIAAPLGVDYPDTDRLRHIAWLAHRTLPYAFQINGQQAQPVYVELAAPGGGTWSFGEEDAPNKIVGSAGNFCRVGAQRLKPEDSDLQTAGPQGEAALKVLRNYAG